MTIYFVELDPGDEAYFRQALPEHDVVFRNSLDDVEEDVEALSTFIYSSITPEFCDAHPNLRVVATRSSSFENIDMEACRARNIAVCYVPHYGENTICEHTFALILALSRRLREVMMAPTVTTARFSYKGARGFDLFHKTLGVVGVGRIGSRVVELGKAFGMEVIAYDPIAMPEKIAVEVGFQWVSFEELLSRSHVVTLHVRLSEKTHHMLNRDTLALCRPGVLIINTARGRLIDTHALREALDSGHVGGVGLDVMEDERVMREPASKIIAQEIVEHLRSDTQPHDANHGSRIDSLQNLVVSDSLLSRPNVVFTPHVAFNSVEAVERLNHFTVENLKAFAAGKPINLLEGALGS